MRGDLLAASGLVMMLLTLTWAKVYVQDFAGDGTEHFEYARSLVTRALPYWDLENGLWGFHHRFMFFAYPSVLSVLAIGPIEAAVRLPGFVYIGLTFVVALGFLPNHAIRRGHARAAVLACFATLFYVNAHYSTWDPFLSDIAEPLTTDVLTTLLVLSALTFVVANNQQWFLAAALPASLSTQFGAVLIVFALGVFWLFGQNRRPLVIFGLLFAVGYSVLLLLYSWYTVRAPAGDTIFTAAYLARYWSTLPDPQGLAIQWLFLLLMTAAAPLAAAGPAWKADLLVRQMYAVGLGYAAVMSLSARVNPHYFLPSAILIVTAFARWLTLPSHGRVRWVAASFLIAMTVVVSVAPPSGGTSTHRASRLAAAVRLDGATYPDRVRLASIVEEAFLFRDYGVGRHTFVYYAMRTPCKTCDYLVTTSAVAPPEHEERYRFEDIRLYGRRDAPSPIEPGVPGSQCVPWLRSLYSSYRTLVEGRLTGAAELPWSLCYESQ
jgi:hypothetical protein